MKKGVLLLSCISILLIFTYFHPTKEIMSCNEQYECKITHEYFGFFNFHNNLNLNQNSFLGVKTIPIYVKGGVYRYISYLEYDNISPFIFYWKVSSEQKKADYSLIIERKRFYEYLLKPQIKYEVSSIADTWIGLLKSLIFISFLIYVFSKKRKYFFLKHK